MYKKKQNNEMSLGEAIKAYMKQNNLHDTAAVQKVMQDWGRLMGRPIQENTEKIWFREGILYVRMNNPVWKSELNLGRSKIRDMLNKEMGRDLINEVKII